MDSIVDIQSDGLYKHIIETFFEHNSSKATKIKCNFQPPFSYFLTAISICCRPRFCTNGMAYALLDFFILHKSEGKIAILIHFFALP